MLRQLLVSVLEPSPWSLEGTHRQVLTLLTTPLAFETLNPSARQRIQGKTRHDEAPYDRIWVLSLGQAGLERFEPPTHGPGNLHTRE